MNLKLILFAFLRRITLSSRKFAEKHGFLEKYSAIYEIFRRPIYNLLRPHGTLKIHAGGFDFYVSGDDYVVASDLITYGCWEKEETEWIKKNLRPGMTVVDIGANFGYFSLMAARLVGKGGRVYAFEPEPKNFELLCRNIKVNGFSEIIIPVPKAVSKEAGILDLFLSNRNYGGHSLAKSNIEWELACDIKVETVALDVFLEAYKSDRVDFIKSDTQGAEPWVFQGAVKTLENNSHMKALIEFWPMGIRGFGESPENFLEQIAAGFQITVLTEGRFTTTQDLKEVIQIAERHSYATLLLEK